MGVQIILHDHYAFQEKSPTSAPTSRCAFRSDAGRWRGNGRGELPPACSRSLRLCSARPASWHPIRRDPTSRPQGSGQLAGHCELSPSEFRFILSGIHVMSVRRRATSVAQATGPGVSGSSQAVIMYRSAIRRICSLERHKDSALSQSLAPPGHVVHIDCGEWRKH